MTTILSLTNVSYSKNGNLLLDKLNWTVQKGETWAILGLNGAGKSTLLRLLSAEFWKSSGEMTVLGTHFGTDQIPQLRDKIGFVSSFIAERFPSHMLAEEIVLTGKYKSSILYRAIEDLELQAAKTRMQELGIAHLIGRSYASLSQGERQSLLIARSLMASPQLLIFDEATSGLDLIARERLLSQITQIRQLKEAPTILYVTHHAEEITKDISHVLLLKEGKIVTQGKREEILTVKTLSQFYGQDVQLLPLDKGRFLIHLKS
ncbi:ABC transporter ATP-binding protein [Streptococcus himalayensis]|uniref:Molybdenum ABC transporter ATP-binding protein n=1 Tax=Streptococcus himalayensis TaxID=1888195 RepID=A0A917A657_9STRE|nr:ABC transporter ATP-binding protein [Streptococcus himalayensis]GGE29767.1 molybdenum ABC transporter ATP-binding protein [Streptococcus himalayensis]